MYVVLHPVVRAQKILHMTPRVLYSVCVDGVVNGGVRVIFSVEIPVRSPAITDDRSVGFNPSIYNGHRSVDCSVRNH